KVLEAFRTHLFRSGLSPKVVERDLANVAAFAEGYLLGRPGAGSLREFDSGDVSGYPSQLHATGTLKEAPRQEALTTLKRFVRCLRDTERMDYDAAEYTLDVLKGRG